MLCAVALRFLADLDKSSACWEVASVIISLFGAMLGVLLVRHYLPARRDNENSLADE